ncbi:PaaI family thioesterase [uncultured Sphingomonas sp.]|uniref:PaaI family thioesterase n=1 Tax=uncultured Sphingomonas sp. TaxID=158754 RepID=UPI0035C994EA
MSIETPNGYVVWDRTSPFLDLIGPIYIRREANIALALRLDERHVNRRGFAHGGLLTSVADVALGYAGALTTDPPTALVTVNLSVDFISSAKLGAWVEFTSEPPRVGSRLAFANGAILADGRAVARTSAVFAVQTAA